MQASPFETGYPHLHHHQNGGVYGTVTGFEPGGFKFHSGGYPDSSMDATACYQNYVTSGAMVTQSYTAREPPSYVESTTGPAPPPPSASTIFHSGFMSSSSPGYYKVAGNSGNHNNNNGGACVSVGGGVASSFRQMDMVMEYNGMVRTSAVTDNFLMKPEVVSGRGLPLVDYGEARYTEEDLQQHQLPQQQFAHQDAYDAQLQQAQLQEKPHQAHLGNEMTSDMGHVTFKVEQDAQKDYKPRPDLGLDVSGAVGAAGLQQKLQHGKTSALPQPPDSKTPDGSRQSPRQDEAEAEADDGSADDSANGSSRSGREAETPQGQEVGEEQGKSAGGEVKPTLSYIALIAKSILESPQRRLNLGSIYGWIEKNFPYYKNRGQGWRNSVRHNLSLNDCFIKAGRCEDGKGNYWAIHPANIQDFMRGDFRQRRRSRRRNRKKDCDLGLYHHHHHHHQFANGYLAPAASGAAAAAAVAAAAAGGGALGHQMTFPPSAAALSTIYSPYTEAERRAYRLDEALLRQSMNNPFFKWYHQSSAYPSASTPPSACNTGVYGGMGGVSGVGNINGSSSQWPQGYADNGSQAVYPLNSSFPRNYATPGIV